MEEHHRLQYFSSKEKGILSSVIEYSDRDPLREKVDFFSVDLRLLTCVALAAEIPTHSMSREKSEASIYVMIAASETSIPPNYHFPTPN